MVSLRTPLVDDLNKTIYFIQPYFGLSAGKSDKERWVLCKLKGIRRRGIKSRDLDLLTDLYT